MSLFSTLRKLHKWFAVIVAVQLLIWIVSGLVFSFIKHKEVGGNFIFKNQQTDAITDSANFAGILNLYPDAKQVSLIKVLDQAAFKVQLDEKIELVDASSFQPIRVNEALIRQIAESSYRGGGELGQINWIETRNDENRGMSLPTWQLVYNDQYNSHLYLSAESGEYQGIRTDNWRIFDFFMMLHFMDFGDRGNFNNGLIIFFASVLVLFSISGILLVYSSFSMTDFTQVLHRFVDNKQVKLVLRDQQGQILKLKVVQDSKLMDVLFDNNLEIDSDCGGGGICATCRVRVSNLSGKNTENLEDHEALSDKELDQGYRLSCQLSVEKNMQIELQKGISLAHIN